MRHFYKLAEGIDVAAVNRQLVAHPELWDANPMRRIYPTSPHRDMRDIWVRARAPTGRELRSYSEPHESVWWPAAERLTSLPPIIEDLAASVHASRIGAVLVTKIPAGKRIFPHNDRGFWHAEFHNLKIYLCLKGNDRCVVWCEHERVVMKAGEAWIFDNLVMHGLENHGDDDRISAIAALRV